MNKLIKKIVAGVMLATMLLSFSTNVHAEQNANKITITNTLEQTEVEKNYTTETTISDENTFITTIEETNESEEKIGTIDAWYKTTGRSQKGFYYIDENGNVVIPQTGDNILIYALAFSVSAITLFIFIYKKFKKNGGKK